jgi:hypothetical protein
LKDWIQFIQLKFVLCKFMYYKSQHIIMYPDSGFDDRIYWTFIQLATAVHKSLSDTLSYSSTSNHTSLFHYSVALLHTQLCSLVLLCTLSYSFVLFCSTPFYSLLTLSILFQLFCAPYKSSERIARKTQSPVVKNACLLIRSLAVNVLLSRACYSVICLLSHCLAMGICMIILTVF